ncbi:hypothetical protein Pcinc_030899 [Petrolisthes cinctipes]|uniref:Ribosomal protein S6 kinase delta-1 n=1 Tax=Petrolisthes cinctipes TaxID=88211 RepID=A0AAE1EXU5_PETCI|nr:hypothetical protein Pcinc_030899 [Petrolisthes cinctipes]
MAAKTHQWVRIFDVNETKRHPQGYTIYQIKSTVFPRSSPEASTSVCVWRRYTEIRLLHREISELHARLSLPGQVPSFPRATLRNRFEADVVEGRRQAALSLLKFIGQHNVLFTSESFTNFIQNEDENNRGNKIKGKRKGSKGRWKETEQLASTLGIQDTTTSLYAQLSDAEEDLSVCSSLDSPPPSLQPPLLPSSQQPPLHPTVTSSTQPFLQSLTSPSQPVSIPASTPSQPSLHPTVTSSLQPSLQSPLCPSLQQQSKSRILNMAESKSLVGDESLLPSLQDSSVCLGGPITFSSEVATAYIIDGSQKYCKDKPPLSVNSSGVSEVPQKIIMSSAQPKEDPHIFMINDTSIGRTKRQDSTLSDSSYGMQSSTCDVEDATSVFDVVSTSGCVNVVGREEDVRRHNGAERHTSTSSSVSVGGDVLAEAEEDVVGRRQNGTKRHTSTSSMSSASSQPFYVYENPVHDSPKQQDKLYTEKTNSEETTPYSDSPSQRRRVPPIDVTRRVSASDRKSSVPLTPLTPLTKTVTPLVPSTKAPPSPLEVANAQYIFMAAQQISEAQHHEHQRQYREALNMYREGVGTLLQGVQGEVDGGRREAVKRKTAQYLQRAEQLVAKLTRKDKKQNQGDDGLQAGMSSGEGGLKCRAADLVRYRVAGIAGKVIIATDITTNDTVAIKVLVKSGCGSGEKTVVPAGIPNMVPLIRYHETHNAIFLVLKFVSGGKLWSHIGRYVGEGSVGQATGQTPNQIFDSTASMYTGRRLLLDPTECDSSVAGEVSCSLPDSSQLPTNLSCQTPDIKSSPCLSRDTPTVSLESSRATSDITPSSSFPVGPNVSPAAPPRFLPPGQTKHLHLRHHLTVPSCGSSSAGGSSICSEASSSCLPDSYLQIFSEYTRHNALPSSPSLIAIPGQNGGSRSDSLPKSKSAGVLCVPGAEDDGDVVDRRATDGKQVYGVGVARDDDRASVGSDTLSGVSEDFSCSVPAAPLPPDPPPTAPLSSNPPPPPTLPQVRVIAEDTLAAVAVVGSNPDLRSDCLEGITTTHQLRESKSERENYRLKKMRAVKSLEDACKSKDTPRECLYLSVEQDTRDEEDLSMATDTSFASVTLPSFSWTGREEDNDELASVNIDELIRNSRKLLRNVDQTLRQSKSQCLTPQADRASDDSTSLDHSDLPLDQPPDLPLDLPPDLPLDPDLPLHHPSLPSVPPVDQSGVPLDLDLPYDLPDLPLDLPDIPLDNPDLDNLSLDDPEHNVDDSERKVDAGMDRQTQNLDNPTEINKVVPNTSGVLQPQVQKSSGVFEGENAHAINEDRKDTGKGLLSRLGTDDSILRVGKSLSGVEGEQDFKSIDGKFSDESNDRKSRGNQCLGESGDNLGAKEIKSEVTSGSLRRKDKLMKYNKENNSEPVEKRGSSRKDNLICRKPGDENVSSKLSEVEAKENVSLQTELLGANGHDVIDSKSNSMRTLGIDHKTECKRSLTNQSSNQGTQLPSIENSHIAQTDNNKINSDKVQCSQTKSEAAPMSSQTKSEMAAVYTQTKSEAMPVSSQTKSEMAEAYSQTKNEAAQTHIQTNSDAPPLVLERSNSSLGALLDRHAASRGGQGAATLPESLVRVWVSQVVASLSALHQLGIIWGDLRPDNLMLEDGGSVTMTYESRWSSVERGRGGAELGWGQGRGYLAPELVSPLSHPSPACDWWSLGALLYHLLTGQSVAAAHPSGVTSHTELSLPSHLSPEAASLLSQLLCAHPTERLGGGVAGAQEVKDHPFFNGVQWLSP